MLTSLALVTIALTVLVGCSDDDDPTGPNAGDARLRAVHLSPDAPAVDIFLNDKSPAAIQGLAFPNGTGFATLQAATYDIAIAASGDTPAEAVLRVEGLELSRDVDFTAVAYDRVASLKALALVDSLNNVPSGLIRVRAIHTASGVGQVDIWNVPTSGAPVLLYRDVDFGEVGRYLQLPAAAYRLGFDVNNDAVPDLLFSIPALASGTVANVFAVAGSGGGVFLIVQFGDGTTARIDPI
jgi:hypothetical protein